MRDDFKSSMFFLLTCGFAFCLYLVAEKSLLATPVGAVIGVLVINSLLFMAQSLGFKWSFLTRTKFLVGLLFSTLSTLTLLAVLYEKQLLPHSLMP